MPAEELPAPVPQVRMGASHAFAGNAGRMVISALGAIVIAGLIGPAHKGTLATLAAVSWMVAVALSVGMDSANRYYLATKKWSLSQSNVVTLGLPTAAGALAFLAYSAAKALAPQGILSDLSTVELTAATVAVLLGTLANQSLVAIREFSLFAKLAMASALANPLIFFALRLAGIDMLSSALWAYIGGQAVLALAAEIVVIRKSGWRFARPNDMKAAISYGLRSYGWHLFNMANFRLDILILRSLSTDAATGAYALATQLSEVVWLVPNSVGAAVFPEIADGGHERGAWTARVCRLVGALSAMMAVVAGAASTLLIVVFMPAYSDGIAAVWLLLPGTIAVSVSQILSHDLNARGRPQASLAGAAGAFVVTVIGGVVLIPRLGVNGAALVSSVAYSLNAAILTRFFTRATRSSASALLPRPSDAGEALRLALQTATEYIRRQPSTEET